MRAESLRFKERGVKDVVKDVFLPWFNAYRFLIQNVQRLQEVHVCVWVWVWVCLNALNWQKQHSCSIARETA